MPAATATARAASWSTPSACSQDLTLYGEGEQTRSFCYVDDLIEGLIRLMSVEGLHDPVNLGNPGEFTIKQLAEEVIKSCDSKSGLTYLPLPADDPRQRKPDITRARELLGWDPEISLRDGLKRTVEDFRKRVN
jgi:UDP-glucuronate decarboxylase